MKLTKLTQRLLNILGLVTTILLKFAGRDKSHKLHSVLVAILITRSTQNWAENLEALTSAKT